MRIPSNQKLKLKKLLSSAIDQMRRMSLKLVVLKRKCLLQSYLLEMIVTFSGRHNYPNYLKIIFELLY